MIQIIICAVAACLATIAGTFGIITWKAVGSNTETEEKAVSWVAAKTRMVSVPIISENKVHGYVIARFEFVSDVDKTKSSKIEIESIVADESFKVIYGTIGGDYRAGKKTDVAGIANGIRDGVNKRWAAPVIKEILIDSWSFLKNKEVASSNEQLKH